MLERVFVITLVLGISRDPGPERKSCIYWVPSSPPLEAEYVTNW